jgi:hypothetical protein
VLNYAANPEIDRGWIPSSAWWRLHSIERQNRLRSKADCLDLVPVKSSTVLGLDMLVHEQRIDLQMASELVLSDVGATIKTLWMIGKEYEFPEERPTRMVDCLASLDVSAWFSAISARTFAADREHAAIAAVWRHCRLVGQYSQLVAESLDRTSSEDAYLVGLLHGIHAIAEVLDWGNGAAAAGRPDILFAIEGTVPPFVLAAIRSANDASSEWGFILTSAHELAESRTAFSASISRSAGTTAMGARL